MKMIRDIVEEVFMLYQQFGDSEYFGEVVSQIEHGSQAAEVAMRQGYDDEVILAPFLHDIGHICVSKSTDNDMMGFGTVNHEKIGADFLRSKGFPERIARLVENHVQAKRYLTSKYPYYHEELSVVSQTTLGLQGGRMTADEAIRFENDPPFRNQYSNAQVG